MDRKYVDAKELACAQIGLLNLFDPEGTEARIARFNEFFSHANRSGAYSPVMMNYIRELMEQSKVYLKQKIPQDSHGSMVVRNAVCSSDELLKILQSA